MLALCCIVAGALGCLWLCARAALLSHPTAVCAAISVVLGTSLLLATPLEASAAAVFVLFAQQPAGLREAHPEEYAALLAAWRGRHGPVQALEGAVGHQGGGC